MDPTLGPGCTDRSTAPVGRWSAVGGVDGEDLGLQAPTVQPAGTCRTAPHPSYGDAPVTVRGLQGVPSCLGHVQAYQTIPSSRALSVTLKNQ